MARVEFVSENGDALVARWKQEWTCPVHDVPEFFPDGDDDTEFDWDWPTYGCTCFSTATWKTIEGVIEFAREASLSRLLRQVYLPRVTEQLNNEFLLQAVAGKSLPRSSAAEAALPRSWWRRLIGR